MNDKQQIREHIWNVDFDSLTLEDVINKLKEIKKRIWQKI
jgi:hypothetical protein